MQVVTRSLATLGLLLGLLALVPLGTTAQEGPAPTVGDIVVDSFDCQTGRLDFHVPVTDLPHIPQSNGPIGATVIGHYEQGQSGVPGLHFNPDPEESPFTGNAAIATIVPLNGEESIFPDGASGPLTAVEIRVHSFFSDSRTTVYSVDCGGGVPTALPDEDETPGESAAPTVGDIIIDSYDCETGALEFHVYVTDLRHIPDSNGTLGYSIIGRYTQGPDSELPGFGYNVPAEESPYTGDLYLTSSMPPTNEGFIYEGSDDPVGALVSIDLSLGVGYGEGGGPSDTSSITYPVECGAAVEPTDPPVDPEPTEPDSAEGDATDDSSSGGDPSADTDDGSGSTTDGTASNPGAASSGSASGGSDAGAGEVTSLPSTGAGITTSQAGTPALVFALGGLAALAALVALRIRHTA